MLAQYGMSYADIVDTDATYRNVLNLGGISTAGGARVFAVSAQASIREAQASPGGHSIGQCRLERENQGTGEQVVLPGSDVEVDFDNQDNVSDVLVIATSSVVTLPAGGTYSLTIACRTAVPTIGNLAAGQRRIQAIEVATGTIFGS